jgi:hypothetical protein
LKKGFEGHSLTHTSLNIEKGASSTTMYHMRLDTEIFHEFPDSRQESLKPVMFAFLWWIL